jgi:ATP-dependent exoDNAse (exonuclease V) alpha subunit
MEPITIVKLSDELESMCAEIADGDRNYFITGSAGTGKTAILTHIKKRFDDNDLPTAVVTANAAAGRVCGGQTMHSFFRINFKDRTSAIEELVVRSKIPTKHHAIIIDEISMVQAKMLTLIDHVRLPSKKSVLLSSNKNFFRFLDVRRAYRIARLAELR